MRCAGPTVRALEELYRDHPLSAARVLNRVRERRGSLEGLRQEDLAHDALTEITDQNHVGGVEFVHALATAARVDGRTAVLDLCCGLGGSARSLAARYGCRVVGIEVTPDRYRQAVDLTARVGLDPLVSFVCGDVMAVPVPRDAYDVVWGQSAWIHLSDKEQFVARWVRALREGGRVAFEDACLANGDADARIGELEAAWQSRLVGVDEWSAMFRAAHLVTELVQDLSTEASAYFGRLRRGLERHRNERTARELAAYELAEVLFRDGRLRYVRMVAARET